VDAVKMAAGGGKRQGHYNEIKRDPGLSKTHGGKVKGMGQKEGGVWGNIYVLPPKLMCASYSGG